MKTRGNAPQQTTADMVMVDATADMMAFDQLPPLLRHCLANLSADVCSAEVLESWLKHRHTHSDAQMVVILKNRDGERSAADRAAGLIA